MKVEKSGTLTKRNHSIELRKQNKNTKSQIKYFADAKKPKKKKEKQNKATINKQQNKNNKNNAESSKYNEKLSKNRKIDGRDTTLMLCIQD